MTDWAVLAVAITGAPSVAAVIVALIISRHRKWADKQATASAKEAAKHHHVWTPWSDEPAVQRVTDDGKVHDYRERYMRICELCGEREYKVYSRSKERWL